MRGNIDLMLNVVKATIIRTSKGLAQKQKFKVEIKSSDIKGFQYRVQTEKMSGDYEMRISYVMDKKQIPDVIEEFMSFF
jgi:hypothetical protein